MKERIKWALVGFSFMFGLQVLIGQFLRLLFNVSANPDTYYFIIVGGTLGAFLIGGMIIGVMLDEIALVESIVAAIVALAVNALLSKVGVSHNPLFFAESRNIGWSFIVVAVAIVLASGGAFIGARINTPQSDWLSNALLITGLVAVVVGPYVLLIGEVPVYALIAVGLFLVTAVGIALWLFTRGNHSAEEISINPDHRPKS